MSKVWLEFDQTDPESKELLDRALMAPEIIRALQDIHQRIFRSPRKYDAFPGDSRLGGRVLTDDEITLIASMEEEFHDILKAYDVQRYL